MPEPKKSQVAMAAAIRQIRKREKLTQEQLAAKAGVHLTWVSRLESGRYDFLWSSLRRVAAGLGVTPMELVALSERIELD